MLLKILVLGAMRAHRKGEKYPYWCVLKMLLRKGLLRFGLEIKQFYLFTKDSQRHLGWPITAHSENKISYSITRL